MPQCICTNKSKGIRCTNEANIMGIYCGIHVKKCQKWQQESPAKKKTKTQAPQVTPFAWVKQKPDAELNRFMRFFGVPDTDIAGLTRTAKEKKYIKLLKEYKPTPEPAASQQRPTEPAASQQRILTSVSSQSHPALPHNNDDFFDKYTVDNILTPGEKNSASPTLILFGHHNRTGINIVAKIFVEYENDILNDDYEQLMYESCIYQHINQHGIANTVRWIRTQHYDNKTFTNHASPELKKQINAIFDGGRIKTVTFIITERRLGSNILDRMTLPIIERKNILYQIIFTLAQMEALQYQHNDLRLGNILIDLTPVENEITYNGRKLPIRYKALLFDWDNGIYIPKCGENPAYRSDYCSTWGTCGKLNPRYDIYTLLRAYVIPGDRDYLAFKKEAGIPNKEDIIKLYKYNSRNGEREPDFRDFPSRGESSMFQAWPDRMCNYHKAAKKCIPFPSGEPSNIKLPSELINHPYFDDLFV
jgi:serine/threonine protein kinase